MTRVSPLRKFVPPLVWPAGVLILLGYCYLGDRMESSSRAEQITRARARAVEARENDVSTGRVTAHTIGASEVLIAPLGPGSIDLRLAAVALLGGVLWVSVLRRKRLKNSSPDPRSTDGTP